MCDGYIVIYFDVHFTLQLRFHPSPSVSFWFPLFKSFPPLSPALQSSLSEMAESSQKRCREEEETQQGEAETKRQCSFHHILSILESDEEDPTQDLSSLITTLQQEVFSPQPQSEPTLNNQTQTDPTSFSCPPPPPLGSSEKTTKKRSLDSY